MRIGSTFTGAGGLDMAVRALWPGADLAWYSEVDGPAAAVFAHHHPDVPNLGDITAVDWTAVEPVDVLFGGFPCQDISHAGKRAGITEETRSGLWFRLVDALRDLRPRLLLVENVAAITSAGGGLDVVLGSLAEIGWDAEWTCVRASDVGAPHRRERWFLAAWPADADLAGLEGRDGGGVRERADERAAGPGRPHDLTLLPTPAVNGMGEGKTVEKWDAWTEDMKARHGNGNGHGKSLAIKAQRMLPTPRASDGPKGGPGQTGDGLQPAVRMLPTPTAVQGRNATSGRQPDAVFNTGTTLQDVAYADRWGDYGPAIARWEYLLGRPAPDPTDAKGRLSPSFVEWMMGWPDGWTAVAGASRSQRLKMLGNGVVPQQAEAAYRLLLGRIDVAAESAA